MSLETFMKILKAHLFRCTNGKALRSPKLFVLIGDQRLYQSFVKSGLLDFTSNFDTKIFVTDDCSKFFNDDLVKRNCIVIESDVRNTWKNRALIDFLIINYRKRSQSLETRIRRFSGLPVHAKITFLNLLLVRKFRFAFTLIISSLNFFHMLEKIIIKWACKNNVIRDYFKFLHPSHLLIISGGSFTNIENIFLHYASKNHCKTGLIIDNWDNLSSKSIFAYKPNIVGVWGECMKKDAEMIHDFDSAFTRIIGSSRVNRHHDEVLGLALKPQILFVGSSRKYFDELELLKYTAVLAAEYSYKVIYRPHPITYVEDLKLFNSSTLSSVPNILIETNYYAGKSNPQMYSSDSLESLVTSIKESYFIVASHSTVIVESLYFGKRVISYSPDESREVGVHSVWNSYTHLSDLKNHPFVYHSHNLHQFRILFSNLYHMTQGRQEIVNQVPEILPTFDDDYTSRLFNFVDELRNYDTIKD